MRKRCALLAVSALFALPLWAQQSSRGAGDTPATTEETAKSLASKTPSGDLIPGPRTLFAYPNAPRPKPFPADKKSTEDTPPGRLTPRYEIAGLLHYANFHPGDPFSSFSGWGGAGEFVWNPSQWLGLAEQVGGLSFNRNVNGTGVHGSLTTLLFGPRLNLRKFDYFVPYAEFLLGAGHAGVPMTGDQSQSSFTMAVGGGVDIALTRNIAWRFAEIDYLMTDFSGASLGGNARQDNLRVGSGIVLRFGLPHAAPPTPPHQPPVAACSANPTSIFAGSGDSIAIHVNASSPQNDPLTYSYTASGGAVDGNGPDARWNSTGVAAGSYTVTAKVDDGKGGTASCATDFKVEERPNRPPTATLSVERSPIIPGEHTDITCNGSDPDGDPLTYSYTTTGGQVSGTGTHVQFDSTGAKPGTYTVKCTVSDGRGGTADASGAVVVQEPPQVHQLELKLALHSIYFPTAQPTVARPNSGLLASQAGTLDTLASDFKQYLTYKPDAHLILGGHADVRGSKEYNQALSERRVARTRSYLIEKGVPADHLDTKAYGDEQNMSDEDVKKLLQDDSELSAGEKDKLLKNLLTVRLANNRRVDVTLSTTGEQSVRRFPFNAHDALTLLNRKAEGGTGTTTAKPAAKKPSPKP